MRSGKRVQGVTINEEDMLMLNKANLIVSEVKKVIVGKDDIIKKVLMAVLANGHILLEDVPGVGKTTLALAFSRAMNLDYRRIQFTPDTMASDIIGYSIYNRDSGNLEYKQGAAFCNFLLADEINRTSSKTQAALLEVMEEKSITIDGDTYFLPEPFVCIATQNPMGSAGTHVLPDSQLDRFMIRLSVGYPTVDNQVEIIKNRQKENPLDSSVTVALRDEVLDMQAQVSNVFADDDVIHYVAELCQMTRDWADVEHGVSPRAVNAVIKMAKANAFMGDRDYMIPEDVQDVFVDVCCHRLYLKPQAKIRKELPQKILRDILGHVGAPSLV